MVIIFFEIFDLKKIQCKIYENYKGFKNTKIGGNLGSFS
jgi:hypothetical protein